MRVCFTDVENNFKFAISSKQAQNNKDFIKFLIIKCNYCPKFPDVKIEYGFWFLEAV